MNERFISVVKKLQLVSDLGVSWYLFVCLFVFNYPNSRNISTARSLLYIFFFFFFVLPSGSPETGQDEHCPLKSSPTFRLCLILRRASGLSVYSRLEKLSTFRFAGLQLPIRSF